MADASLGSDYESLQRQIERLGRDPSLPQRFYEPSPDWTELPLAQGDVLRLQTEIPVVDAEGYAAGADPIDEWLLVSNTCDLARRVEEVPWATMAPVRVLNAEPASEARSALQSYRGSYRKFYLPPRAAASGEAHTQYADLSIMVTAHKRALQEAVPLCRLAWPGWVLLHSCLIRLQARPDDRFAY